MRNIDLLRVIADRLWLDLQVEGPVVGRVYPRKPECKPRAKQGFRFLLRLRDKEASLEALAEGLTRVEAEESLDAAALGMLLVVWEKAAESASKELM